MEALVPPSQASDVGEPVSGDVVVRRPVQLGRDVELGAHELFEGPVGILVVLLVTRSSALSADDQMAVPVARQR